MKSKEGIIDISPEIKRITFDSPGKMAVLLQDGRLIIVPLSFFPSIKKMEVKKRIKHHIDDGKVIVFDDCNEVYHIEQILGRFDKYAYKG